MNDTPFILWFNEIGSKDVPLVGGKNASLGEMYRRLTEKGVMVPKGFAITAEEYKHLLKEAGIEQAIRDVLEGLDTHNIADLGEKRGKVRDIILNGKFPKDLEKAISDSYSMMERIYGKGIDVAVRSSTAEYLPDASFAGQQDTYLNIRGSEQLLDACHCCFASLFTNRAISYRHDKGFGHMEMERRKGGD